MAIHSRFSLLSVVLFASFSCAQSVRPQQPAGPPQPPGHDISVAPEGEDETRQRMNSALAKKWNKDRQEAIRKDSEKLLELAEELKNGVQKSNENVLAVDVIRKAEEIEKLAHSVKEKMKGPN